MAIRQPVTAFFLVCVLTLGGCAHPSRTNSAATGDADACRDMPLPAMVSVNETPAWTDSETLPRYCRVRGTIQSYVQFEMRLPEKWNGRFMMAGCGGFCGKLLPDKPGHSNTINSALKRGYAAIAHDGGHQAENWETHWATDPMALELWAHKVLPVVSEAGIQLATALYGEPPRYRYFSGCSNGGRLGLMAAQRYPALFDGIAAGASVFDLSGTAGLWGNWLIRHLPPGQEPGFPRSRLPMLASHVMERCDPSDGQRDGLIADPRRCDMEFTDLVCADGADRTDDCLTGEEAALLDSLYGGVRNDDGDVVYPSVPLGSEHFGDIWLFGTADQPAWGVLAADGYRKMLVADLGEEDQPQGLSTEQMTDWISRSSVPALSDATDPDLTGLREAGHKLLIYQGWADPLIIPQPIVDYYHEAARANGGLESLREIARLVMIPGWGHCWERPAPAPDEFDPLLVLEKWVEQGQAPDYLVATQAAADGAVARSRRLCAYPSTTLLTDRADSGTPAAHQCISEDRAEGTSPPAKP